MWATTADVPPTPGEPRTRVTAPLASGGKRPQKRPDVAPFHRSGTARRPEKTSSAIFFLFLPPNDRRAFDGQRGAVVLVGTTPRDESALRGHPSSTSTGVLFPFFFFFFAAILDRERFTGGRRILLLFSAAWRNSGTPNFAVEELPRDILAGRLTRAVAEIERIK